MEGQKFALGLVLVLVSSGCMGMTGQSSESPSFDDLSLNLENVEKITGEDYSSVDSDSVYEVDTSGVENKSASFFRSDKNLSEAPESVKSLVVALNSSDNDLDLFEDNLNRSVDIEGYEARALNSSNRTVLFKKNDNISFIVETRGGDGFYSYAKELYVDMAEDIERFRS